MLYRAILLAAFSGLLSWPCISQANDDTLTFGIVPQQSAKKLAASWQPLLTYLSDKTGVTIVFSTAKDIPTFEARLASKQYDIAYMNPYHYTEFHDLVGYQALARQKNKSIVGVIIVPVDSEITRVEDLHGLTMAFPAPAAFAASILPQAELARMGISVTPQYVFSHDSVYLNVSKGFLPAGGGIIRTLNSTEPALRNNLKVLWESRAYTPHAIATAQRLDPAIRAALLDALLALSVTEDSTILAPLKFDGFEKADNADWDDVRALGIQSLARPHF